ncbi:MFS transporter [Pseudonocardia sp. KRD291]|uniref:MFS transporter n=1 Tax=Pseudonocardia sp. KRD291 TaxID=2792007 RepID=UPI001C4A6E05|nr:MFS transporter [Pseudonocardia sp. KRD291]MBW0101251.1 MFS transporter [Pseudonocardia sp. KRD291]
MSAAHSDEVDRNRNARRAALAGGVGTLIEFFDFSVYAYVSVTIAPLFFPGGDPTASLLATLAVFGTAYVVRPLGGILFGHLGDRHGRRTALVATVVCMGAASTLIGLLPTHASIGAAAAVLLLALRLVQGLCAGGEIGGATTLIAELAPSRRRTLYASAPGIGGTLGFGTASAVVALMIAFTTPEQMTEWGWRIPFLVSVPLTVLSLWARRRVPQDPVVQDDTPRPLPVVEAVRRSPRGVVLTAGLSLVANGTTYIGLTYFSIHLVGVLGYPKGPVAWITMAVIFLSAPFAPLCGIWADRIGVKRVALIGLIGYLLVAYPVMLAMGIGSLVLTAVVFLVFVAMNAPIQVATFALMPRLFDRDVRYSGVALGYNIGVVIAGGSAPLIATWLVSVTGDVNAPAFFVGVVVLLGTAAVLAIRPSDLRATGDELAAGTTEGVRAS